MSPKEKQIPGLAQKESIDVGFVIYFAGTRRTDRQTKQTRQAQRHGYIHKYTRLHAQRYRQINTNACRQTDRYAQADRLIGRQASAQPEPKPFLD